MSAPKVMSGARAKIGFIEQNVTNYIGIYNNFSYSVRYDVAPAYILGRYSAASLDYTSMEVVQATAVGYRVIGHGPHTVGRLPKLADLLNHNSIVIACFDRLNPNKAIAQISDVRPAGYSTTIAARQLEDVSMQYVGILCDDEDTDNVEAPSSMDLMQTI